LSGCERPEKVVAEYAGQSGVEIKVLTEAGSFYIELPFAEARALAERVLLLVDEAEMPVDSCGLPVLEKLDIELAELPEDDYCVGCGAEQLPSDCEECPVHAETCTQRRAEVSA